MVTTEQGTTEVTVPDIGDYSDVPVIEVLVAAGDAVNADDPLVTLESDKATMDIPAPLSGTVASVLVAVGDRVSEGTPIAVIQPGEGGLRQPTSLMGQMEPDPVAVEPEPLPAAAAVGAAVPSTPPTEGAVDGEAIEGAHAGPGVRRLAREIGVDLAAVTGTGPKGRITKEDLLAFVRGPAGAPAPAPAAGIAAGAGIPPIPAVDFAKFGPVETQPLSRIARISGPRLHASWLNVPHVTHADEADITELDAFRRELDAAAKADGYRVTLLSFLLKASVSALQQFPTFNSSLSPDGESLVLKRYYHLGVAVDTPGGLVVPVLRDVDRKGVTELSKELGAMSAKARDGKLSPADMSGGTFTISSLGGIGGTHFTPIVNAPEVAIMGVVRSKTAPVWDGDGFQPRLMLPLSVSYDHRVIDGALAARFLRHVCHVLEDVRRLVL
ncbi:MAG TPA: dihydrolipoyllysine-residue acetyltransferase [Acidimicrobiia bacterium]|jgi:pyruvate dehydrogenase E2 component (dihydrolipoamide acetyltransferase)|nr:dihydrolipoyllysine-residue acetyltransferase [Acidimicrobiia bacterium]